MKKRKLGRTGLDVTPIALGSAPLGYRHLTSNWDPYTDKGRLLAINTINHALDRGINYIDTAPLYGDDHHSELLIGDVMKTRRHECVLATKVWYEVDSQGAIESVEQSLRRLQTDHIDVLQIHGLIYSAADVEHVTGKNGPLEGLRAMRDAGKIGHIGITAEEPFTLIPFLQQPDINVYQAAYNFIYQSAARHFLPAAAKVGVGIATMRTMTSGMLPHQASFLAPELSPERLYEISLKFVLSDSRLHVALSGMRWPEEVDRNVEIASSWTPPIDFESLPRSTKKLYEEDDAK